MPAIPGERSEKALLAEQVKKKQPLRLQSAWSQQLKDFLPGVGHTTGCFPELVLLPEGVRKPGFGC